MKKEILVYGASGHAKVIIDIIEKEGRYKIMGIIDDNPEITGKKLLGYEIIGGFEKLEENKDCRVIIGIGDNITRKKIYEKVTRSGHEFIRAVHPSSQIGRDVSISLGTVVMANATINTGSHIRKNVIINTGATIDHDCVIEDFVHISPGVHLAGNVTVGELSHIGIGASIVQGIHVGKNTVVGAGAAVIENVPDNVVVAGVPARVVKKR
jgi:sugar O-acyltransferase (sialic acid O-acetyltransferase NeuD family)